MSTTEQAAAKPSGPIDAMMTVADINRQFSQCKPVFEKYGIAGCGGEFGPPEPLFIFAAAHHVPLKDLVTELNMAVRGEWKENAKKCTKGKRPEGESADGETLFKRFIWGAMFVAITFGMMLGAINITRVALAQSYFSIGGAIKQAHGHAQIFGWVGLMIMGVAFHAVPRFKMVPLAPLWAAKVSFAAMLLGVLLRAIAQPLAAQPIWGFALVLSGFLELTAIVTFVTLLARVLLPKETPREFYEKYIWASAAWFTLLGLCNLHLTVQMANDHTTAIPAIDDALLIHAGLFGFIANMIFAFSLRVLPHFLGLRDSKIWAANVAFWLWNGAIFFRYPHDVLAWIASSMEMVAAVLFVYSLGIFAKRRTKVEIKNVDPAFGWFINMGYAWFIVAASLPFHADIFRLSPSSRHTMTIGFITSIMLGVAQRVLPVFCGVNLYSNRLLRTSFWLLAAGSTLAFAMALSAVYEATWSFALVGATGWFVFAAVAVAGWNLAMTLSARAAKFTRESAVKLNTRITEMLEVWPELRPVLIHGGLSGLARMGHNPPSFVTVEFAAKRHGVDPNPLIEALNSTIQTRLRA